MIWNGDRSHQHFYVILHCIGESATHIEGLHVPITAFGRTQEASDVISHHHTREMATANCVLHQRQANGAKPRND
jgi:hypothetical protein